MLLRIYIILNDVFELALRTHAIAHATRRTVAIVATAVPFFAASPIEASMHAAIVHTDATTGA